MTVREQTISKMTIFQIKDWDVFQLVMRGAL